MVGCDIKVEINEREILDQERRQAVFGVEKSVCGMVCVDWGGRDGLKGRIKQGGCPV